MTDCTACVGFPYFPLLAAYLYPFFHMVPTAGTAIMSRYSNLTTADCTAP